MAATTRPTFRFSGLAIGSFVLGLASLMLLLITGIPALFFGYFGLRSVNLSDGRLKGARLAVAGMALGGLGTLVSLVLLAAWGIQIMRDRSQIVECKNNLRRLGVGLSQFEDDHRSFPPGTVLNDALAPEQRLSWIPVLLPYLEMESPPYAKASARRVGKERELYAEIDFDQAWDAEANRVATATPLTVCACRAHSDARRFAWTTYVGIAGVGRDAASIPDFHPPHQAAKDPNVGVFGYDRWTTRVDVTRGVSETLMVAETSRANGPWAQGGPTTVRGIDPNDDPPIGYGRPWGGLHPGGVVVLFVDGHVDMIRDTIEPETWRDMARISVNEAAPP